MKTRLSKAWRWLRKPVWSIHWTAVRGPYKGYVVGIHFSRLWHLLVVLALVSGFVL